MANKNDIHDELSWQKIVLKYTRPRLRNSIWQIVNSFIPYLILWVLMYWSLQYSFVYTLLLAVLASGFLIRLFIIFHDCGHGSFFKSKRANLIVGQIMGILSFTPYHKWHDLHHQHHVTNGNLDKRGTGDVWTMTVDEYLSASHSKRLFYRLFRNPVFLFSVGPLILLVLNRLTTKRMSPKIKSDVYNTNLLILIYSLVIISFIGLESFLVIQLLVLYISHVAGLWLFYIQHQFEDVNWDRGNKWDYKKSALHGSSFLKLNPVIQWFTGNIGFHHVHHLSSKIPNYNLAKCHYENDFFRDIKPVLFKDTFKALRLHLWDEENQRLIRFRDLIEVRPELAFNKGRV